MSSPFIRLIRKHRKSLAVGGSLVLHGVILWMLLTPSSSRMAGLDQSLYGPMQTGVNVDLMSPDWSERPPETSAPMAAFRQMTAPAADGLQPLDAPKPGTSLADIFGHPANASSPQATAPSAQEAHITINDRNNATSNDLWKAIEPCWKRLADKTTLGVTLSVSFSPLGNLSRPPLILRDSNTPITDQQLRSENLAITALSQCGPYLMAFGQNDVKVNFPNPA